MPIGIFYLTVLTKKLKAKPTFLKKYNETYIQKATANVPIKRLGTPEDVANLACFLAMPGSSYITGQCIIVDGGLSIYGFPHLS